MTTTFLITIALYLANRRIEKGGEAMEKLKA